MKHSFLAIALAVCTALICANSVNSFAADEEKIPALSNVRDSLSDKVVVELNQRRTDLLKQRADLKNEIMEHENEKAEKNTPNESALKQKGDELRAKKKKHIEDSKKFNQDVAAAARVAGLDQADQDAVRLMKQRMEVVRSRAKAFAAWKLGAFLLGAGQTDEAKVYLKEARKFYADPDSHENDVLNRLIYDPQEQKEIRSDSAFLNEMFPPYGSQAEAVLDALDYGRGDLDQSIKYLTVAGQADPKNLNVRDALNYVRGIAASEQSKKQ